MISSHVYFMESESESHRLNIKTDRGATLALLISTGLNRLPQNPKIVDAGCGTGIVSSLMLKYLSAKGSKPNISLIDASAERLRACRTKLGVSNKKVTYIQSLLEKIPLPDNSQDYVFSRFVFEYLQNPEIVFRELKRITKKGGKLIISDLDNNSLNHFGLSPELDKQLDELSYKLWKMRLVDPWVGRKLFSFYYDNKFRKVKVHFSAHHLFYGKINSKHIENWTSKINQIIKYQLAGKLKLSFDARKFGKGFIQYFNSPRRFSYTPLITVEGVK